MASTNKDHTQLFARIRLHGLTKSSNGTPCPIDLERRISFPAPVDHRGTGQHDKDLSPRILTPTYDIEARVRFDGLIDHEQTLRDALGGALGYGRSGVVYALKILSFKHSTLGATGESDEKLELPTLPPLCIKLARPGHARELAREAWFYEQLDANSLTGLITPRCYGIFHTPNVPDELTIDIPKSRYYQHTLIPLDTATELKLYTAPMEEELYDFKTDTFNLRTKYFMDDEKESWTKSEWRHFRETPAVTTMTIILMDMLGPRLSLKDFEKDWEGEINDICDHLIPFDVVHDDLRLPNILRVPSHLQVPCPMHPHARPGHKWNLIDWEVARMSLAFESRYTAWCQRDSLTGDYYSTGGDNSLEFCCRPLAASRRSACS